MEFAVPYAYRDIAIFILDNEPIGDVRPGMALAAARRAWRLAEEQDPVVAEVLCRALLVNGEKEEAAAIAKAAIAQLDEGAFGPEDLHRRLESHLEASRK